MEPVKCEPVAVINELGNEDVGWEIPGGTYKSGDVLKLKGREILFQVKDEFPAD